MLKQVFPLSTIIFLQEQYAGKSRQKERKSAVMQGKGTSGLNPASGVQWEVVPAKHPDRKAGLRQQFSKDFLSAVMFFSLSRFSAAPFYCMVYPKNRQESRIRFIKALPASLLLHLAKAAALIKKMCNPLSFRKHILSDLYVEKPGARQGKKVFPSISRKNTPRML